MERNSLGQVIVKEGENTIISIPCKESFITIDQYNRFLLNEKEFTELTPTVDKDALINSLTEDLLYNQDLVRQLSIDINKGFLVSVVNPQYSYPVNSNYPSYNGQQIWENIGFDDDTTPPNFNSRQSNGKKFWNMSTKNASIYQEANSRAIYNLKAYIKYRFIYTGNNPVNIIRITTNLQFWNGNTGIGVPTQQRKDYQPTVAFNKGDKSEIFEINLDETRELGASNDTIYIPAKYSMLRSNNQASYNDFIMEILPGSTFSLLPT